MKKAYFSEIIFKDEYYIDGINIFDDISRRFIKYTDVDLGYDLSFSKLQNASLYLINGLNRKFKIFIKQIKDFYIIGFLSAFSFLRAHSNRNNEIAQACNKKNTDILLGIALKNDKRPDNCIYSNSGIVRAVITETKNKIKVEYQHLCIFNEYDFHFHENISSKNFFWWENLDTTSYFENLNNAQEEIRLTLNSFDKETQDFHFYHDLLINSDKPND